MQRRKNKEVRIIRVKDTIVEYTLIISDRKTIGLQVDSEGNLTIRANKQITVAQIEEVIMDKYSWINKAITEMKIKQQNISEVKYVQGEIVSYLGQNYTLQIIYNSNFKKDIITIKGNVICITSRKNSQEYLEQVFCSWCKNNLRNIISERIAHYKSNFNIEPKLIQVKEQKRRWGSCSYDNKLMFNWRLIRAPIEIIDYVVVHEMSHMEHKNHSQDFWNRVESVIPNYKDRDKWLKENGLNLQYGCKYND